MDRPSTPPPPTPRLSGRRVLLIGLIIVLGISGFLMFRIWSGLDKTVPPPGSEVSADSGAGSRSATSRLVRTVVYTSDMDLMGVKLKEEGFHVGDDMTAFEVEGHPGVWAVDLVWYYLGDEPLHLYTYAEMLTLEQTGRIDSTTPVGFAVYRFEVKGTSTAEVAHAARAKRPMGVPPPLLEELRLALTAADTTDAG